MANLDGFPLKIHKQVLILERDLACIMYSKTESQLYYQWVIQLLQSGQRMVASIEEELAMEKDPTFAEIVREIEKELAMSKNGLGIKENLLNVRKQQDSEFAKASDKYTAGRLDAFASYMFVLDDIHKTVKASIRDLEREKAKCLALLADSKTLDK